MKIKSNFIADDDYFFADIARKVKEAEAKGKEIVKLSIGSPLGPLPGPAIDAMRKALDEMATVDQFRGYGPELGYDFLRDGISKHYQENGVDISSDEITISQGINEDISKLPLLFEKKVVGITDPVYPVYLDTSLMQGLEVVFLPMVEENDFKPQIPEDKKLDLIYLCSPNNPTGTALTKDDLRKWVDYARKNKSIILFDAAYEAFRQSSDVPFSIYEIEGAKECCIEFKSFSKDAGFAGVRVAYAVVPVDIVDEKGIRLLDVWKKFHATTQNGASYITQRAAEAMLSEEGQKAIKEKIEFYQENCRILSESLKKHFTIYGGVDAPYIWIKCTEGKTSVQMFEELLDKGLGTTPGSGFGACGEGFIRVTGFGTREETLKAAEILTNL